jgi:hypothetical protein
MRLINVETYQLSEFFGDDIPPYAILSHRWGRDEVNFEQMSSSLAAAEQMRGFQKIMYCAAQTKYDGLDWCWVDTCCIDKRSSSELSEAINSMYQWYQQAVCCYAYLEDAAKSRRQNFIQSKWFKRGWTLQELIAPQDLTFYDCSWLKLGEKKDHADLISQHCGIDKEILRGTAPVDSASIAQRMQWASSRQTSRVEDIAYCLMGIFDINMPLLYGEGRKAFTRLQEEIIKRSTDQSIFTWIDPTASRTTLRGLFARSPSEFQNGLAIQHVPDVVVQPFAMTNRGLHITLPLQALEDRHEYLALLGCRSSTSRKNLVLRLRRLEDCFVRVDPDTLYEIDGPSFQNFLEALYVPEKIGMHLSVGRRTAGIKLNIQAASFRMCNLWYEPGCRWEQDIIRFDLGPGGKDCFMTRIVFESRNNKDEKFLVMLVYNPRSDPMALSTSLLGYQGLVVQAYSCEAYVGIPRAYPNINETPSVQTVEWLPRTDRQQQTVEWTKGGQYLNFCVTMGQQMTGDEMVFVTKISLCDDDID